MGAACKTRALHQVPPDTECAQAGNCFSPLVLSSAEVIKESENNRVPSPQREPAHAFLYFCARACVGSVRNITSNTSPFKHLLFRSHSHNALHNVNNSIRSGQNTWTAISRKTIQIAQELLKRCQTSCHHGSAMEYQAGHDPTALTVQRPAKARCRPGPPGTPMFLVGMSRGISTVERAGLEFSIKLNIYPMI